MLIVQVIYNASNRSLYIRIFVWSSESLQIHLKNNFSEYSVINAQVLVRCEKKMIVLWSGVWTSQYNIVFGTFQVS